MFRAMTRREHALPSSPFAMGRAGVYCPGEPSVPVAAPIRARIGRIGRSLEAAPGPTYLGPMSSDPRPILLEALARDGSDDLVELRYHAKRSRSVAVEKGRVDQAKVAEHSGVGVRVLADGTHGFATTDRLDVAAVLRRSRPPAPRPEPPRRLASPSSPAPRPHSWPTGSSRRRAMRNSSQRTSRAASDSSSTWKSALASPRPGS